MLGFWNRVTPSKQQQETTRLNRNLTHVPEFGSSGDIRLVFAWFSLSWSHTAIHIERPFHHARSIPTVYKKTLLGADADDDLAPDCSVLPSVLCPLSCPVRPQLLCSIPSLPPRSIAVCCLLVLDSSHPDVLHHVQPPSRLHCLRGTNPRWIFPRVSINFACPCAQDSGNHAGDVRN